MKLKRLKKLTVIALAMITALGTLGISVPTAAAAATSEFTLTVPETLEVQNAGWNPTAGLGAKRISGDYVYDLSRRLVVTADSDGEFALVNEKDPSSKVSYRLASDASEKRDKTRWEFSAFELNDGGGSGTVKPLGIILDNYNHLPAGIYTDTVTFTANAEAVPVTDLSTLTLDYTAQNGEVLTGTLKENVKVSIADGAAVTLKNAVINGADDEHCKWPGLTLEGDGTIILAGENVVRGFHGEYSGVYVPEGKTLVIKGDGSLDASSNGMGAGIGGGYFGQENWNYCGNIVIEGGTITATGGLSSPGIGAGHEGKCGDITITGGTVVATGGDFAAGIGCSTGSVLRNSRCGKITITDTVTSVTANRGTSNAYSIGLGWQRSVCGAITIGGTLYYDGKSFQNNGSQMLRTKSFVYAPGGGAQNASGTAADASDSGVNAETSVSPQTRTMVISLRIEKNAEIVTPPAAGTLLYNGKEQALVTAGKASGGELQYALGKDGSTAPAEGWSAEIPRGTDAGTYYVWYRVKADEFYTDSEPVCLTVTIEENTLYPVWIEGKQLSTGYVSGTGWSYEGGETGGTLTLKNALLYITDEAAAIVSKVPLTIVLEGRNRLRPRNNERSRGCGITADKPLTIRGSGSLVCLYSREGIEAGEGLVISDGAEVTISEADDAIRIPEKQKLVIENSTVSANGDTGISAGNAEVLISGSTVTAVGDGEEHSSFDAKTLRITDGSSVKATGNRTKNGINAGTLLLEDGSSIEAAGTGMRNGITISGEFNAGENCTVTASGSEYGIYAFPGSVSINGSSVKASGAAYVGLFSSRTLAVSSGVVEARGGNEAVRAREGLVLGEGMGVAEPAGGRVSDNGQTVNDKNGKIAPYAQIMKDIKVTFIGSSLEGESIADSYVLSMSPGSDLLDIPNEKLQEILAHFTKEGFAPYGGQLYAMTKPLSDFGSWEEVQEEDLSNMLKRLTENTVFYLPVAKTVDIVSLSVEQPECGTKVVYQYSPSSFTAENQPVVTADDNEQITPADPKAEPNAVFWADEEGDALNAVLQGGMSYAVRAKVYASFGYQFDAGNLPSVSVANADDGSIRILSVSCDSAELNFEVPVEHQWGEWMETVEPTCTKAGTETRMCLGCGAAESRETAAYGHTPAGDFVIENKTDATCTEDGSYDRVTYCKTCEKELDRQTVTMPALGHDWSEWKVTTKPTCEDKGEETRTCSRCSEKETREVRALRHEWGKWAVTKEATQDEEGQETRICSRDSSHIETRVIPKIFHIHVVSKVEKKAAKCLEDGNTEYYVCDQGSEPCGRCFAEDDEYGTIQVRWNEERVLVKNIEKEDTVIPATGKHTWDEGKVTTAPTCITDGVKTYTCTVCGETKEEASEKTFHDNEDVQEVIREAGCTQSGYHWNVRRCKVCGEVMTKRLVQDPKLGHDWGEWVETSSATCTENGMQTRTCSRCEETETFEIPALGHSWGEWTVKIEPDCETEGERARTCTRCTAAETVKIPALGHSWGEWTVTKEPDCETEGERARTCTLCGEKETVKIPALGHSWGAEILTKEPTCTEAGEKTKSCLRCGMILEKEEVPALGHAWGEWTVTTAPTCTEPGEETSECSRCGEKETRGVKALGHKPSGETVNKNEVDATCTEAGSFDRVTVCERCGEELYSEHVMTRALGHDYQVVEGSAKAANCTEAGKEADQKCSRCDSVINGAEIPALGHDWGEWTVTKQATKTKEGEETRTCKNDSAHKETRVIPMADHVHHVTKVDAKGATCTATGNVEYYVGTRCRL